MLDVGRGLFFDRARMLDCLQSFVRIRMRWNVPEDRPLLDGRRITYCGFLVERAAG